MDQNDIHIATVGAPFGVRGAFRLKTLTEHPEDALSYGPLHTKTGDVFTFHRVRVENDYTLIVTSPKVKDRTDAEHLKGCAFFIHRDQLPPPHEADESDDADTFYAHDLIGLRVVSVHDGAELGHVKDIVNYGASDIMIVTTPLGEAQIAFIEGSVHSIDRKGGVIAVEPTHMV